MERGNSFLPVKHENCVLDEFRPLRPFAAIVCLNRVQSDRENFFRQFLKK
jgi:hypothetical protein